MARNPSCTIYIGNLDEKVTERVLYEILIQAGRLVDLYMPCDKESNRPKGFAFAEFESEEIANYAVRLFSGIVRLNNKTLKFAMSGQDKSSPNSATPVTPKQNTRPNLPEQQFVQALTSCRFSAHTQSAHPNYAQASPHGSGSNGSISGSFEYGRRTFGQTMNTIHVQNSRY